MIRNIFKFALFVSHISLKSDGSNEIKNMCVSGHLTILKTAMT